MLRTTKEHSFHSVRCIFLAFSIISCMFLFIACSKKNTDHPVTGIGTQKQLMSATDTTTQTHVSANTADTSTQMVVSASAVSTTAATNQIGGIMPQVAVYGYDDSLIGLWLNEDTDESRIKGLLFFSNGQALIFDLTCSETPPDADGSFNVVRPGTVASRNSFEWTTWYTEKDGHLLLGASRLADYTIADGSLILVCYHITENSFSEEVVHLKFSHLRLTDVLKDLNK